MTDRLSITAFSRSDVGRVRQQNEDALFTGTTVFAVADGMGGAQAGEVASETALKPIRELDGQHFDTADGARRALVDAVTAANRAVVSMAEAEPSYRGMGTTLTAAIVRSEEVHVAHVGDSRAYLLREGEQIDQLTTDHTVVEQLIREGRLSRDEASTHPQRSLITRAVGVEHRVDVDALPALRFRPGDQLLLCSDGLTGPVGDEHITEVLRSTADGDEACRLLVDAANDAGGPDNISVVLLRAEPAAGTADVASRGAAAARPRGDTTDELEPVLDAEGAQDGAPPAMSADDSQVTRIRTRQESGDDWASSMGRYGAPQGHLHSRRSASESPVRSRRILPTILAVAVLLVVLTGGGYVLLSRAYFVGDHEGTVAIYRGLSQEVAGIPLYWLAEDSDLETSDLPFRIQGRIEDGVTVGTLGEARRLVDSYRTDAEEEGVAPADDPDDGGGDQ